jgi:3-oxoacyl-[acyl-carrier-protein] synthase-3
MVTTMPAGISQSASWKNWRLKISSHGTAFPRTSVDNECLAKELALDPNWIEEKGGVRNRFVASHDETTITLGAAAALNAMQETKQNPDLLICCTCTSSLICCPVAPSIALAAGLSGIAAFDINAACSGGLIGLIASAGQLVSGFATRVLLVCSDTMTKHLCISDKNTRILFGDGAAALLLESGRTRGSTILSFLIGSDGRGAFLFGGGHDHNGANDIDACDAQFVKMNGPALFRFAVEQGSWLLTELCAKAGVPLSRIARVVLHQSNSRITRAIQRAVPIPEDRWILGLENRGNITSASVVLSLIDCLQRKDLQEGDLILIGAFGAGLTWAGLLFEWSDEENL